MRPVTLKQIHYFIRVVELGSLSRAAEACNVAQPALGAQIRTLEQNLGIKLLTRRPHGMLPTRNGRVFFQHCLRIEAEVDLALEEVARSDRAQRASVLVGLTGATSLLFGEGIMRLTEAREPEVEIRLIERSSDEFDAMLADQTIEMCFSYSGEPVPGAVKIPLFHENLQFVVSARRRIGGTIAFAEVLGEPLVMQGRNDTVRELVNDYAARANIPLKIAREVGSIALTKRLVNDSDYGTVLSASSVVDEVRTGKLKSSAIVAPRIARTIYFAFRPVALKDARSRQAVCQILSSLDDPDAHQTNHLSLVFRDHDALIAEFERQVMSEASV